MVDDVVTLGEFVGARPMKSFRKDGNSGGTSDTTQVSAHGELDPCFLNYPLYFRGANIF